MDSHSTPAPRGAESKDIMASFAADYDRRSIPDDTPREPRRTAIYAAIARYDGRDAGHVCYARTSHEAREKAQQMTTMTTVIRRELATAKQIEALTRVGKL